MVPKKPEHPILGPGDMIAEGDSRIVYDAFRDISGAESDLDLFTRLRHEVAWQKMYHAAGEVPRLVCVQGDIDPQDGSMPIYRHPSDQSPALSPFSPTVEAIRLHVEKIVDHQMNHVLIQLYRDGHDYISEHSDKTLDIVRGSSIVNVSLGAERTMRLRTKRNARHINQSSGESGLTGSRITQLVPMPHGSVFVLGLMSNMKWLHGINPDKRSVKERSESEKAFKGERISLTFRNIGTFLSNDSTKIWGQGASAKDKSSARFTISGHLDATQQIINAFGFENQQAEFDWQATYGEGFDVLHFRLNSSN